jgi:hypothetical protein
MLKKLLAVFAGAAATGVSAQSTTRSTDEALLLQIAERSKTDPLAGAKIGGGEVAQRLLGTMKTERGVHIESILCALGALAEYACQASVRAKAVAGGLPEVGLLTVVRTKDGRTYYFGDNLNKPLAESTYSVWSIAGGSAQQAGCSNLPDLSEIFKHTSSSIGTPSFGRPRVPEANAPHDLPIKYVRTLWPTLRPLIVRCCPEPEHWPILLGFSIAQIVVVGRSALDPCLAVRLVMESAIPMSKVDLSDA